MVLAAYDYGGNFLCVHAVGAVPVLIDVTPHNSNLDPDRLAAAFSPATKAVIVSHLHGGLVPMASVVAAAHARGVAVIEDAAQAPGAVVQGRRAGTWGDVGVLSFGGSKLLTAGRGGAILTPHADVLQRARLMLHRGNVVCPLSELQAAVLLPQLDCLDDRNARRRAAVARLLAGLRDVSGLTPFRNVVEGQACYYKLGFRFDAGKFGLSRRASWRRRGRRASRSTRGSAPYTWPVAEPLPARRRPDRSGTIPRGNGGAASSRTATAG